MAVPHPGSLLPPAPAADPQALARLAEIGAREAGIVTAADKRDFLVARIGPRLAELGLASYAEYARLVEQRDASGLAERRRFVEVLTTHTTSFYRERGHYDWMIRSGLAELAEDGAGRSRDLVIWSAACSTGPELYSALMAAIETGDEVVAQARVRGIGTDLSSQVIRRARQAVYPVGEIGGIPEALRPRVLLSARDGRALCRIAPDLRARTEWKVANLIRPGDLSGIEADIVFLRNVLIYFDPDTRGRVLDNVLARLRPGGVLFTGHAETGEVRGRGLATIRPSIYRKARR